MSSVEIPGLGPVVKDEQFGWYTTTARPVAALDGATVRINIEGYDDDPDPAEYIATIADFLQLDRSVLLPATAAVFDYYQDTMAGVVADQDWDYYVEIPGPERVWEHVTIGTQLIAQRFHRDGRIYLDLECECAWEPEQGLQIVIRDGRSVTKVGPYDGHLTNSSARDEDLNEIVYVRINPPDSPNTPPKHPA